MSAPDLSIIIVNYNGAAFLPVCLAAIAEYVPCTYEVIIVDNASTDDSVEILQKNYADEPNIRLVLSTENTGFTGGNNLGVQYAQAEYILLLNNDTKICSSIAPVLTRLAVPSVGAVGCRLSYADGRLQPSVGYWHRPLRLALSWLGLGGCSSTQRIILKPQFYASSHETVEWVSGAFLATKKTIWQQLGGLDANFFMYVEDVDYCLRVAQLGYVISYQADTEVLHYEGAGKAWIGQSALLRTMRSYLLYLDKHHGILARVLVGFILGYVMLLRAAYFLLRSIRKPLAGEKSYAFMQAALFLWQSIGLKQAVLQQPLDISAYFKKPKA